MPSTTTDPIPVRALNQVTYCPRLYYLQYVDAVMPTNEHVEGGLFDHRRVDNDDLKGKSRRGVLEQIFNLMRRRSRAERAGDEEEEYEKQNVASGD